MSTRRLLAALIVLATALGRPVASRAEEVSPCHELALSLGALGLNLLYVPAKTVVALGGTLLGSVVGLANGGDVRSAYALWVPAASGTFILHADNLDGTEPIEFFGRDYADRPSPLARTEAGDGGTFYESLYR